MAVGTVSGSMQPRAYGFIMPQDGGKDVFVHITAVQTSGPQGLNDGQKVTTTWPWNAARPPLPISSSPLISFR